MVFLKTSWVMGILSNRKSRMRILYPISTLLVYLLSPCLAGNVPANFVFGDSLVDAGNNNYIVSLSKANYIPNGIDFGKPTGRYTNGRTIVDIIGRFLYLFSLLLDSVCLWILELMPKDNALVMSSSSSSKFSPSRSESGIRRFHSSLLGSNHSWRYSPPWSQLCFRGRWNS